MEIPELLLIDKPQGITSFDVIRRLRRQYSDNHNGEKAPKMGHAGTLDPMATGLMLLGVGKGTKKLTDYIKLDKEYVTEIVLGTATTSGDMDGEVTADVAVDDEVEILRSNISTILSEMVGTIMLPVSAFSAIKIDGVPMYKRARAAAQKGEVVADVPMRDMSVLEAELLDVFTEGQKVIVKVRFFVGSGTYIRSLGEELGRQLGYPATLRYLRRTQIGEFTISDAQKIEEAFV